MTGYHPADDEFISNDTKSPTISIGDKVSVEIKGILFDLDGTLIDTESLSDKAILFSIPGLSESIIQSYASNSYRIPWELKKQLLGLRGSEWAPIVIEYAKSVWNVEPVPTVQELWTNWELKLNELCEVDVQPCPGAIELVDLVHTSTNNNISMAIATSSRNISVEKKRKCIEQQYKNNNTEPNGNNETNKDCTMFSCMKAIVCGDHPNVIRGKPEPDIYIEAARQINIEPKYCIAFEDALSGIRSAKAAGCALVVGIPDERFNDTEKACFYKEADIVINSLWDFDGTSIPGLESINMPALLKKLRQYQNNQINQ